MHQGGFPESSSRTGRVFGRVGQVFMHRGASLGHLLSLPARAEQALSLWRFESDDTKLD
jgi:hypothetical protein